MNFWHMQLHPNDLDWGRETELLKKHALIGFGDWEKNKDYLKYLKDRMRLGDIIAIKNGMQLIALVEVIGDYEETTKTDDLAWFEHRRKVKVLGWNTDKNCTLSQPRGTLNICDDLGAKTSKTIVEWYSDIMRRNEMTNIIKTLKKLKQIVFFGPPGTGKTYKAKQIVDSMLSLSGKVKGAEFHLESANLSYPNGAWALVQFHPSYNYEDFVRGIQAETNANGVTYHVKNRIFAAMCDAATRSPGVPFIIIIDEINRANVSSVLGELIYALEYRGEPVSTPYAVSKGDASITIPENLYVIGTMNTADRSIGHIDYAVRRRFAFEPLLPDKGAIENYYTDKTLKSKAVKLFDKVQKIFEEHVAPEYDKDDVAVGHSYFMASDDETLTVKMKYQVIPLLKEYVKDGVLLQSAQDVIQALSYD